MNGDWTDLIIIRQVLFPKIYKKGYVIYESSVSHMDVSLE